MQQWFHYAAACEQDPTVDGQVLMQDSDGRESGYWQLQTGTQYALLAATLAQQMSLDNCSLHFAATDPQHA